MPSKRPNESGQTGAQMKRARMRDQRAIPVQQSGRAGGSAVSGNNGLPATIEVEKFAQARSFEIAAMQKALKNAKEAGTQRAFQSLPRHLRRRAASHNIRRLPGRLRAKALIETPKDAAKPKKKSRTMIGRKLRRRVEIFRGKTERFLKRQRNKVWLETHVWHAKRMHMTTIWGHRLAWKPTMKAFRASYRASVSGALLVDASYYQYIELKGEEKDLREVVERACGGVGPGPGSKRFSTGVRTLNTQVYAFSSGSSIPSTLIGPVVLLWDTPSPISPTRRVLLRLHPSICSLSLSSLNNFVNALNLKDKVEVVPHDKEFLTFELTGKRSTEVVKGLLNVTNNERILGQETKEAWKILDVAAGPGSVPEGMVLGLEVYDPRLSFPPKLAKAASPTTHSPRLQPSIPIASCTSFWDAAIRSKLKRPTFTKQALDSRRSSNLILGTPLTPIAQDDRIPILLTQSALGSNQDMAGWTLIVPSGHGMSFWSSLVFSETRVGGLRERGQIHFEAGLARFPEDFPGTKAFDEHEERREVDDRGAWERRPPAKRCNWKKVGTEFPWKSEIGELVRRCNYAELGQPKPKEKVEGLQIIPKSVVDILAKRSPEIALEPPPPPSASFDKSMLYVYQLAQQRAGLSEAQENGRERRFDYAKALVRVKVTPCGRGSPEELGLLYKLDNEDWNQVREKVGGMGKGKKKAVACGEGEEELELCKAPSKDQTAGRITTGSFSLRRGKGYAVGVIPLSVFLQMSERDRLEKETKYRNLCLFRNRDGEVFRAVTLETMLWYEREFFYVELLGTVRPPFLPPPLPLPSPPSPRPTLRNSAKLPSKLFDIMKFVLNFISKLVSHGTPLEVAGNVALGLFRKTFGDCRLSSSRYQHERLFSLLDHMSEELSLERDEEYYQAEYKALTKAEAVNAHRKSDTIPSLEVENKKYTKQSHELLNELSMIKLYLTYGSVPLWYLAKLKCDEYVVRNRIALLSSKMSKNCQELIWENRTAKEHTKRITETWIQLERRRWKLLCRKRELERETMEDILLLVIMSDVNQRKYRRSTEIERVALMSS